MKKLVLFLPLLALAGCATETRVHPLGHDQYIVCDTRQDGGTDCDGANPEKGIRDVCFPRHQVPVRIERAGVGQGIVVTCGEPR